MKASMSRIFSGPYDNDSACVLVGTFECSDFFFCLRENWYECRDQSDAPLFAPKECIDVSGEQLPLSRILRFEQRQSDSAVDVILTMPAMALFGASVSEADECSLFLCCYSGGALRNTPQNSEDDSDGSRDFTDVLLLGSGVHSCLLVC